MDVIEHMHGFDHCFHDTGINRSVNTLYEIQNTENFEIELGLWKISTLYIISIHCIDVLDVVIHY